MKKAEIGSRIKSFSRHRQSKFQIHKEYKAYRN